MVKSFRTDFVFTILLISTMITSLFTTITTTTTRDVYGQAGSMATLQNIGATYAISIVPGAAHKQRRQRWFNNVEEYNEPSLVSINDKASVKEAICIMRNRHVRRLLVKKADGGISGITTLRSAVGNIPSQGIDLAEVELPGETPSENVGKLAMIICPYCQSPFEDKRKIDKHMDTVHLLNCWRTQQAFDSFRKNEIESSWWRNKRIHVQYVMDLIARYVVGISLEIDIETAKSTYKNGSTWKITFKKKSSKTKANEDKK
jgi:CBS domain-containing protein